MSCLSLFSERPVSLSSPSHCPPPVQRVLCYSEGRFCASQILSHSSPDLSQIFWHSTLKHKVKTCGKYLVGGCRFALWFRLLGNQISHASLRTAIKSSLKV